MEVREKKGVEELVQEVRERVKERKQSGIIYCGVKKECERLYSILHPIFPKCSISHP